MSLRGLLPSATVVLYPTARNQYYTDTSRRQTAASLRRVGSSCSRHPQKALHSLRSICCTCQPKPNEHTDHPTLIQDRFIHHILCTINHGWDDVRRAAIIEASAPSLE